MSKIKLLVEIDEEEYKALSELSEREKVNELSYYEKIIAHSKPCDDSGDCISRSKLQEDFKKELNFGSATAYIRKLNSLEKTDLVKLMLSLIDNAPTVEARPQGECRTCRHRDPEDKKCDCGELERAGCPFPVSDDYYCKFYEKGGAE